MTTKQMKHMYEANPDEWIVLWAIPIGWMNHGKWVKSINPAFNEENYYKLVHIKHKQVLEAYLADNNVYIGRRRDYSHSVGFFKEDNFIENYNPDLDYRLKEKYNVVTDFNNTYCEATELHKNNIEDSINEISSNSCSSWNKLYFINTANKWTEEFICVPSDSKLQQIYYDTTKNKWIYTIEKAEPIITNKEEDVKTLSKQSSQSISSELSDSSNTSDIGLPNINNFQDYGFTADFAGEILKEVGDRYIGYILNKDNKATAITWDANGVSTLGEPDTVWQGFRENYNTNLTPIKKEWYENPANFPALVIGSSNPFVIDNLSHLGIVNVKKGTLRLATKAERDSLYAGEEH